MACGEPIHRNGGILENETAEDNGNILQRYGISIRGFYHLSQFWFFKP